MKYLSIDTETGGLGTETSLLTLGFVLADDDFNSLQEAHYCLKPDDGIYKLTAEGMEINKINIAVHGKAAISYKEAKKLVYDQIYEWSRFGEIKLIPIGKQIDGDVFRIHQNLISKNTWENFVSYRHLDASAVFMFLQNLGYYTPTMKGSLKELCEFHQIDTAAQHDALADARMTLQLVKKMKELLKPQGIVT